MTRRSLPAPLEQDGYRGYVVRYIGMNGLKLALIIAGDGRTRAWCHFWTAAAGRGRWSLHAKSVPLIELRAITDTEKQTHHVRIASAITSAHKIVGNAYT